MKNITSVKWSIVVILVCIPLFLLLSEHLSHTLVVVDADTAVRSATRSTITANIVEGSMRSTDINVNNIQVRYNYETIQTVFDENVNMTVMEDVRGNLGYITIAQGEALPGKEITEMPGHFPTVAPGFSPGGRSGPPPMLAIRSNVVRQSTLYGFLSNFMPMDEHYNIQNQRIGVLEVK